MLYGKAQAKWTRALVLALPLLFAGSARAEDAKPDKKACFEAHEKGQVDKGQRKLKAASKHFQLCASEACPAVVREECGQWLTDLRTAIPSVVPAAVDAQGRDVAAVKVLLDGEPLTDHLDGRSYEIDPGEHTFQFVLPDGSSIEQKHVLNEGDTRRRIAADFSKLQASQRPQPVSVEAKPSRPIPLATWVLGGVGVAALGSFAFFALTGKSKENELKDQCAPSCPDSEVDKMDQRYLAADISLGVSLVSLGVATYLLVTRKPAISAPSHASLEVIPTTGAGMVRWSTRF